MRTQISSGKDFISKEGSAQMKDKESGGVTDTITVWSDYIKHLVLFCLFHDIFFSFFLPNCLFDHHMYYLAQMKMRSIFYLLRKVVAVGENYGSKGNVH